MLRVTLCSPNGFKKIWQEMCNTKFTVYPFWGAYCLVALSVFTAVCTHTRLGFQNFITSHRIAFSPGLFYIYIWAMCFPDNCQTVR